MYTHPLFLVISLIFVTLAPVLYVNSMQKRKRKKNIDKLNLLATENGLNLDIQDSLPNLLMGMDSSARKLLLVEILNARKIKIVDLQDCSSCELYSSRSKSGGIDRVGLSFRGKGKNEELLLLYDEALEIHPDAVRRLQLAERWRNLINRELRLEKKSA